MKRHHFCSGLRVIVLIICGGPKLVQYGGPQLVQYGGPKLVQYGGPLELVLLVSHVVIIATVHCVTHTHIRTYIYDSLLGASQCHRLFARNRGC